ncbi:putative ATP-dependent DEAD-box RNA helicase [Conidiobolus coronatus NRRL 28638]|uniref:RNA helicase n=1 Tax=Conidiobolus coronatus (strain ATCC 28846 / CBS 209.66 / NRRL 28638) TaxID=796925 RepID=A0A137PAJ6_CONC2|nr:putative ATP-dependent DEAD-box RNA helicase [Conidiobolus coronatus NRRL 28638]|eukprot:KXN71984.1 putative ATP-dependent DEAD-box RNA helicase [Conidiobolus coronatus NRRL 28638]
MDLFYALGSGANFNKQKFKKDIDKFVPSKKNKTLVGEDLLNQDLPKGLDFFNTHKHTTKKAKVEKEEEDNVNFDDEDDEEDSDEEDEEQEITAIDTDNRAKNFRKKKKIHVHGNDIPYPINHIDVLQQRDDIPEFLKKNLTQLNFNNLTPIQMQSIPTILSDRDTIACAPTGTGKTLSFAIPIIAKLEKPSKVGYRALIISPTRELAQQINDQFERISKFTKFKIHFLNKATSAALKQDPQNRPKFDVLVTTPLRLVQAIKGELIDLSSVKYLIFDEADKLFEPEFVEQIDDIISACSNSKLKKALFSATLPDIVEKLASSILHDPVRILIGNKNSVTQLIKQELVYVGQESGKLVAIRQLISKGIQPPVLIFVQSIERAKELFHELIYDQINVDVIHSERTQSQRGQIIQNFKQGKIWVLICTELMARGIDFKGVNLVINYDFPQTIQSYVHRIGRTGRAGRKGEAITLFTDDDSDFLRAIVNVMRQSGCDVPQWMLELKKPSAKLKKQLKKRPIERKTISTLPKHVKGKLNKKRISTKFKSGDNKSNGAKGGIKKMKNNNNNYKKKGSKTEE